MSDANKYTLQTVGLALDVLTGITHLTTKLGAVSALLQLAQSQGREITEAEFQSLVTGYDLERLKLQQKIDGK